MSASSDDLPSTIEPSRSLTKFSPEITWLLRRIDAALAAIQSADIWPSSAEALRFSAQVGTIHYSTLIEGNRLGVLEAERAARGELDATTKAEIELVNYVDALKLIDSRMGEDGLEFNEQLFKDVHYQAMKGLGTPSGPFKPHHEGEWRDGEAGVWDPFAAALVHTGCPQTEVRPRMLGLIDWVADAETRPLEWPPAVIAGILHYNVAEDHPYADGNGRTARLLTSALLTRHGMTPGRMFNFDAHYGRDKEAYLAALRSVRQQTYNHEWWMRYFLTGLADEYERVLQEVNRLAAIGRTGKGHRVQLSGTQERALTALAIRNVAEFNREDYEAASGLARSAAAGDLKRLAEAQVVVLRGQGPSRRYRFASGDAHKTSISSGRAPRAWPEERIETELRELVADAGRFPPIRRFDEAGRRDLYQAVLRTGGSKFWAERLGLEPPKRGRPPSPK